MPTEKPKGKLVQPLKVVKKSPKKNKGGRPEKFTTELKASAVQYVKDSGYWKVRLAKHLRVSVDTLDRRLKRDKSFAEDIEAAESDFIRKTIQGAKPEFILRSKYKDEFPENNFDPGAGQGGEELEAVIVRIRKILPASGQ